MPLTALKPTPDFLRTAQASRAWTRRIERADEVPEAIEAALAAVTEDRRCALLEVRTLPA